MLALSFASILWAESRDSAWTSANQLAVYGVIFVIGLWAIRGRSTARAVMLVLGLPALIGAVVLMIEFTAGGGAGAFLQGRLDTPEGYINGTAGLFVMGIWPWLGFAETLASRWLRAAAISAAALIAGTAVLTQSRAIVLATAVTIVLVLIAAPGRTRRGVNLLIVFAAVASTAHWTLRVYSSTGPSQSLAPSGGAIQGAGLALLGAALIGFALKWLVSTIGDHLPEPDRKHLTRQLGRALLAVTAIVVIAGAVAERGRIQTQWHDFTALKPRSRPATASSRSAAATATTSGGSRADEFEGDPLGGVGAGQLRRPVLPRRRQLEDVTVPAQPRAADARELGIGGAIGLCPCSWRRCSGLGLTRRRDRRSRAGDPALKIAALGMFTAWFAATSVDWLYDIPGLAGMAMLAAAVLVVPAATSADRLLPAPDRERRFADSRPRRSRWSRRSACWHWWRRASDGNMWRCSTATRGTGSCPSIRCGHCSGCGPPSSSIRGRLRRSTPWRSAYARLDDYSAARAALSRAEQLEPDNYVPPALLGDIATRAGDEQAALSDYRRALRLDPLEPALQQAVGAAEAAAR